MNQRHASSRSGQPVKKPIKIVLVTVATLLVGVILVLAVRIVLSRRDVVTYVTQPVGYADISSTVSETGTINPVNEVQVGSEESGKIATLGADFNSIVHAGDVIATLDATSFQASLASSQASLQLALANLGNAKLNVNKMKAQYELAKLSADRDAPLVQQGMMAQSQLDADRTAANSANQDYLASQGAVLVAQAQVTVAQSQVSQAQYNLDRTIIRSPIDGIVLARNISAGQTVSASLSAPTLFVIAANLSDLQVDTSVDEADVGSVRSGQQAQITVTAYPNTVFRGTVDEVRVEPTTVQNVVTYDAVVQVHDTSGKLLPGMTAQVTIATGTHNHVVSVPLAALLYQPGDGTSAAARRSAMSAGGAGAGGGPLGGAQRGGGGGQRASAVPSLSEGGGSPLAGAPDSQARIWLLRNGKAEQVVVTIGLSDVRHVEIASGDVRAGDQVIVAEHRGAPSAGR